MALLADETVALLAETRATVLSTSGGTPMDERVQALTTAVATAALSDTPPEEARRALGRLSLESKVPTEDETRP